MGRLYVELQALINQESSIKKEARDAILISGKVIFVIQKKLLDKKRSIKVAIYNEDTAGMNSVSNKAKWQETQ